ncbi:MAG: 1-deoxy-D-xylulose-5-phosphate reductoisomerase [Alphaproteobacteria bacterium]|nr:1-deoxy-D-xylulose-5-phosphate reductoisomerase [Alphaproteobacteria bacterium]MBU0859953.1 1-deoxy-D-xylulose-5-phosphate reductoisomerase [Alphaproteobacteria bacterium]
MSVRTINILGATGSVGRSTLDVVASAPDMFDVQAVTAHSKVDELAALAVAHKAKRAVIADEAGYAALKDALAGTGIESAAGRTAVIEAASMPADITMAAIVGLAGLEPVMAAIAQGKCVAIANKEPLVAAGAIVMAAARTSGATLLPVDSEHNAIFQGFEERNRAQITRLILTASGGPFRTWSAEKMNAATPAQAVAHPNWSMGAKISVDSATMMNKALEVIEARYLFDMPGDKIDVLVHPQSIIHSLVEYTDGSMLAQLGAPDMRTPIAYCLAWPERMPSPGMKLDLTTLSRLDFEPLDVERFPAVGLAYDCLRSGGAACVGFNALNEVAVAAFLEGRIGFGQIVRTVQDGLQADMVEPHSLDDVLVLDAQMRERATEIIARVKKTA